MPIAMQISWIILCIHWGKIEGSLQGSCIHGGVKFKHGDFFLPQDPMLRTNIPGRCTQCHCQDALVLCEIEDCPPVNCDSPVQTSQYCCPQCAGVAQKQEQPSSLIFPSPKKKVRRKNDCVSGGKYYKEGSLWQPVMGPLGVMSCVQCECHNGEVVCTRYHCRELPCSHPRIEFGHCCPVCPELENAKGNAMCLPRSSEVFVYKTPKLDKSSYRIDYCFLQPALRPTAELHSWNTRMIKDKMFQVAVIPRSEITTLELKLIGSTSYKQWTRFVRREKRLSSRCTSRCFEKIINLEETLKLYPVSSRSRCHSDELDTFLL